MKKLLICLLLCISILNAEPIIKLVKIYALINNNNPMFYGDGKNSNIIHGYDIINLPTAYILGDKLIISNISGGFYSFTNTHQYLNNFEVFLSQPIPIKADQQYCVLIPKDFNGEIALSVNNNYNTPNANINPTLSDIVLHNGNNFLTLYAPANSDCKSFFTTKKQ